MLDAEQAVAVAVDVACEIERPRQRLPCERAVESEGGIASGARDGEGGKEKPGDHRHPHRPPRRGRARQVSRQQPGKRSPHDPCADDDDQQRDQGHADLAQPEQDRIDQAPAAELLEQREADRVAEVGMELVLRGKQPTEQRAVQERKNEAGRPGGAAPRETQRKRPACQPDHGLSGEVAEEEQGDLARRIDRARLAETAGEQPILAIGERQLDQRDERHERERKRNGEARPCAARARRFGRGNEVAVERCGRHARED